MTSAKRSAPLRVLLTGVMLGGCTGSVLDPTGLSPPPGSATQPPPRGGDPTRPDPGPGPDPTNPTPEEPAPLPPAVPAPSARLIRLTHEEWTATVRDLFGLGPDAPAWASAFRIDPNQGGFLFGNQAEALEVDESLHEAYAAAAAAVVSHVMPNGDLTRLARWLPADGADEERARRFAEAFGLAAHRRPLDAASVDAYLEVYRVGRANALGAPRFAAGIGLMMQAFLRSPLFLYRVELSEQADGELIPLDDWELASRLSYALWGSMPDAGLFALAAEGRLQEPEVLRGEVDRLLADPRAARTVERFHAVLLDFGRYEHINPSRDEFPGVPRNLPALALEESRRVIADAYASEKGWRDLMDTTETWVNQDLARIYGLDLAIGPEFQKVTLPASERRGVFTHIGWLASHATALQPDPIHRGVYLTDKIACNTLAAPPAMLPPLPPPNGRTNRQVVADHTESRPECAACHATLINPYGFAFEAYGATGAIRTVDNGLPVETHAEPLIGSARVPVSGAVELAERLAASEAVHRCYAKHWIEFTFGRRYRSRVDAALAARLGQSSLGGASIRAVLAELVTSPAFTHRSTEELP